MNWDEEYFLELVQSYLFAFRGGLQSEEGERGQAAVYSLFHSGVLDCFLAIHQDSALYYVMQSAETEK